MAPYITGFIHLYIPDIHPNSEAELLFRNGGFVVLLNAPLKTQAGTNSVQGVVEGQEMAVPGEFDHFRAGFGSHLARELFLPLVDAGADGVAELGCPGRGPSRSVNMMTFSFCGIAIFSDF